MDAERLRARVSEATSVGAGRLRGWRFACNKSGADGSAKANIEPAADAEVWGVIYRFDAGWIDDLDRHEGGYERRRVEVHHRSEQLVWCQTYCSERVVTAQLPARWYREHMVVGADAHGLPAYWIAMLRQLRCA